MTRIDSQTSADAILETFATVIRQHLPEVVASGFLGVAVGCPGPFDYQAGISQITGVAKYESIYGVNVRASLRERLGTPTLPVVFRNDAEAAIVGEARYGAGGAYRRLIGITLGTGFGSAFIANGASVSGEPGVPPNGASVSGEPGVPPNGWLYCVPFRGVPADEVFSTRGLLARLRAIGAMHDSIESFAEDARRGDNRIRQGFAQFGRDLGEFLTSPAAEFGAEAILVLGGIAGAIDLFGPALTDRLSVSVLAGQLGASAPLLGAAELLFEH